MKRTEKLGWFRRMRNQPYDFLDLLDEVEGSFRVRYPSLRIPKFLTGRWPEHELLRLLIEDGPKARLIKILGKPLRRQAEIKKLDLTGLPSAAPIIAALSLISTGEIKPVELKIDSTWKSQVELILPSGIQLILNPVG